MATGVNIRIDADGRRAKQELKAVSREVKGLGLASKFAEGGTARLGVAMGVVAGAAAAQLAIVVRLTTAYGSMLHETATLGDQTAKMARNVGVSAEALQTLQFAAGRSGVEMTALNNGLKRLSRNMLDSVSGNKRMADTFEAIGVNVRDADGNLRDVEDVFRDLADVSAKLGESAEGTGLRMLLLGRAGAELGNLMAGGSAGVDEMSDRLDDLRGRMSGELLQASEAYQDALLDLGVAFQGLKNAATEAGLPALTEMVKGLTTLITKAGDAKDEIGAIATAITGVIQAAGPMIFMKIPMTLAMAAGAKAAQIRENQPPPDLPMGEFFPPSGGPGRDEIKSRLSRLGGGTGKSAADTAADAEERRAEMVERQIRGMERRMRLSAAGAEEQIRLRAAFMEQDIARRLAADELNEAEAERLRLLTAQQSSMEMLALRRDEALEAARTEAEQLREMRRAEEEHGRRMMQLEADRAAHRAEVTRASVDAVTGWLQVGADVAGMIYNEEAKRNKAAAKDAFEARRAFLISQTVIGGAAASIQAFANAPNYIVGAIQSALVVAQTAVAVAAIAAEKPSFGDAGLMPLGSLRDTHRSAVIRNDEMVVDPRGTRDISAMFAMMRRGMELAPQREGGMVRVVNVIDGQVVTDVVERQLTDRIEQGNDFRQRTRV